LSAFIIYQFYIQNHSKQLLCPFKNPLSSSANVKSICLCFIRNTFLAMFSECVSTYFFTQELNNRLLQVNHTFFSQQLEHSYNKWPLIISPQSSIRCTSYNTTLCIYPLTSLAISYKLSLKISFMQYILPHL